MGNLLEKLGLKKSQEQLEIDAKTKNLENNLKQSVEQYEQNKHDLINNKEAISGIDPHQVDTQTISALENSLESLRKIILETAEKLGKDGNSLIADIDEKVRIAHDISDVRKAA